MKIKKLAVTAFCFLITFSFTGCRQVITDLDAYEAHVEKYHAASFMPDVAALENCEEINYSLIKDELLFLSDSLKLIVKYTQENFDKEKERLADAYTYLDEPRKAEFDETCYTVPVTEFTIDTFAFKITEFENTVYPKEFGIVGISEETCEIAYLWLYAPDLDYIAEADENGTEAICEFVNYTFAWEENAKSNKSKYLFG